MSPTLVGLHCTRTFAWCLDRPLTINHFRLLFFRFCVNSKSSKGSSSWSIEDMNHEQSTSSMMKTRTETTHGLTYSVSRVIGVTAWQSVNAFCLRCLTHGSCHWTQIPSGYCDGATGRLCQKRWLSSVHAISTWPAACAGPACVQHALARPDSQPSCVVHVCTFVIFCDLRFSHILITVICMQRVHVLHLHSLRLALQCHAFI